MTIYCYPVRRRIRPGVHKDVKVMKPKFKKDFPLWKHCIGRGELEITYRSYVQRQINDMLFIHGISCIHIEDIPARRAAI